MLLTIKIFVHAVICLQNLGCSPFKFSFHYDRVIQRFSKKKLKCEGGNEKKTKDTNKKQAKLEKKNK